MSQQQANLPVGSDRKQQLPDNQILKQELDQNVNIQQKPLSINEQEQVQLIPEVKAQELKVDEEQQNDQNQKCQQQNPAKATEYKNIGNDLFKEGKYSDAILEYQQGLKYTGDKNVRATFYSNMAICFMKQEDYPYAKKYCLKALKQDENHRKSRMNLGRCFQNDNKIQQAFEQYKKVEQNLEGASSQDIKFIKDKIAYLKPKVDQLNQSRKKQVMDGLKNIGNTFLGYFGMSLDNFKLEQGPGGGYNISFKQ